jgi:hypothetical protein
MASAVGMLARRALGKVLFGAQRRQLLSHRDVDEPIERDPLCLGGLPCLVEQRGLKSQREIALPHDLSHNRSTVSTGSSKRYQLLRADFPRTTLPERSHSNAAGLDDRKMAGPIVTRGDQIRKAPPHFTRPWHWYA